MKWYALFLVLIPTQGLADWRPSPVIFSYAAAFDQCRLDPDAPDLVVRCDATLADAYALKRAVARAALVCAEIPLKDCPLPFEDEGLPAIAVRIAVDAGCNQSLVAALPADTPLPADHCISMAADIMGDEGVVPLDNTLDCTGEENDCLALARVQTRLWTRAVVELENGPLNDPMIDDLAGRVPDNCAAEQTNGEDDAEGLAFFHCVSEGYAALWRDLTNEDER